MLTRTLRTTVLYSLVSSTLIISGCRFLPKPIVQATPVPKPTPKPGPQPPKIDYARIRPNELGRIPVIMYHEIKGTQDKNLVRSIADFKQDLELMYKAGFCPINLSDVVNDNIDVPAGKSPIVLTFDDARASQFKLIETADSLKVDPDCAVGILEDFHKKHPDWPLHGTFFVLPKSDATIFGLPKSKSTMDAFGQVGMGAQKMAYLIKEGFEIGNHTTTHRSLRRMTSAQIQQEIGYANNMILSEVPDAKIQVFAAPMGYFPKDKNALSYILKGSYEGKPYEYKAAFAAAWRPIPSPDSKDYKPLKLERIDSVNGTNGVRDWIQKLTLSGGLYQRYVSDGDPNVISYPKGEESQADIEKIKAEGKLPYSYEPYGGVGGAKPIISVDEPGAAVEESPTDTTPPGAKKSTDVPASPGAAVVVKPIVGGG
jgi:peptidoglycan/xylan/chitin deacetylase (PgdA/CDA1 family)